MAYVKGFIFTLIVSLVVGFGLAYLQEDKEYETTVEFQSSDTKEYIQNVKMSAFPKPTMKYNENLTGQGKLILKTELYTPIFVKLEAPGYKTKRGFYLWNANEVNQVFLEVDDEIKVEEKVKNNEKDTEKIPQEPTKEEEPKKVELLPTFK